MRRARWCRRGAAAPPRYAVAALPCPMRRAGQGASQSAPHTGRRVGAASACSRAALLALLLLWPFGPGRADEVGRLEARQLSDLFRATCLAFVGDAAGVRDWLQRSGYQRLPSLQERILLRRSGQVFDASAGTGHLAVLSFDNGWCMDVADDADETALVPLIEAGLQAARISLVAPPEQDGAGAAMHHRRYRLLRAGHPVLLIVNTRPDRGRVGVSLLITPVD